MIFDSIKISELIVNPKNDRHSPTESEDVAILWLLQNKTKEMKKLALRIAKAGRVFDPPMVVRSKEGYIVKDGNRRVTCVKLILDPLKAPPAYRVFFESIIKNYKKLPANEITCQIETDPEIADEIIGLRHGGTQEGEGQLNFGTREKARHANRTSGKSDYTWAQKVEEYLNEKGFIEEALSVKRSTLDKILDTKTRRSRFGIVENEEGKIASVYSDEYLLKIILKLVADMKEGNLTLKNLLTTKDKNDYIDVLISKGFVIESKQDGASKKTGKKSTTTRSKGSSGGKAPKERDTLIKRKLIYDFQWTGAQSKISEAWEQLQYHLVFKTNKFAIAVVFRTLLDLTEQNFRNKHGLTDKKNLAKNLKSVGDKLVGLDLLEKGVLKDISRIFDDKSSSISIENLQRILHSKTQMPSKDDLMTMWDCLEPLIVTAIRSSQNKGP